MPLRIKCPSGHTLIVPDDRAGRTLECPRCNQAVVVPGQEFAAVGADRASVASGAVSQAKTHFASLPVLSAAAVDQAIALHDESQRPVVKPKSRVLPLPPPADDLPAIRPHQPPLEQLPAPIELPPAASAPAEVHSPPPLVEQRPSPEYAPVEPVPFEPAPVETALVEPAPQVIAPPAPALPEPAAPEPAPPPFVPRSEPVTVSLHADAASTVAVYQLAAALVAASVFSVVPAVWDLVEYLQIAESQFVARWALGLLFLGVVQLAYAVYLFQLPDWTTVWVVTVFSLFVAAIYAAVLGLVLLSPPDGFLVGEHGLQLADKLAGGRAALWCLCMVSLSTILAFFSGRLSTRWHKTEMLLRACA